MRIERNDGYRLRTALIMAAILTGAAFTALAQDEKTLSGEVVDMMCYMDHGAKGADHASCAKKCIKSGGPVGLLTTDDQLYVVIGDHKPMNSELAPYAGKTVTLKGKVVERNGVKMIENAELEK